MGYGGSTADAGRALGRTGDDGVDGVIHQDALGLDRVYIQAKGTRPATTLEPGQFGTSSVAWIVTKQPRDYS